jgi:hypothetical protein
MLTLFKVWTMRRLSIICIGIALMSNAVFAALTDSFEYENWDEAAAAGWKIAYGSSSGVSFVTSAPDSAGVTDGLKALMIDVPGNNSTNMGMSRSFSSTLQREWTLVFDWYLTGTATGQLPETGMRSQVKVRSSANNDEVGFWIQYNNDGGGVYPRTLDFIVNTAAGGNSGWKRIDKLYNAGDPTTGDFPLALINGWNRFELSSKAEGDLDKVTVIVNGIEVYTTTGAYGIAMDEVLFGYWRQTYANKDGYYDNLKMAIGSFWGAHNPIPNNGSSGQFTDVTLSWEAGLDPNDPTMVNPAIKKHYVWLSSGDPADPNLTLAAAIDVSNYNDPAADGSFAPATDFYYDSTYYWMIEEGIDDGQGGVYPPGEPNNIVGPVWSFQTAASVPAITLQPVSIRAYPETTAEFRIEYLSVSAVTGVTWYKNGLPLSADGDISVFWDQHSSTLSIANVDGDDEASYYAVVTNGEESDPTAAVQLVLNKKLAWYQFEQNADDSAGTNHGTVFGGMDYAAGQITDGGQAYAADPNGTNYILLSTDAYPKAGFGNGLDAFTYSCWVKLAPGEGGIVLGVFNDGQNTGLRFSINSVENDISVYMRQQGAAAINPRASALATDSQWHFVAATYDGSDMKIYIDGVRQTTATNSLNSFAAWQYAMTVTAVNSRGSINDRFSGQIDDLKIYNYAFTGEDIAQEYLGVEGGWICDADQPELAYDFDKNCQIDLGDLAIFAATWLDSNRVYPQ